MMESLADISTLETWLIHYGSFALFFLLVFGILALPIPEETLMVVAGALMHHGKLHIPYTIVAALMGSVCGITSSYILGKTAGIVLVERYGKWLGIKQVHLDKAHGWFEQYGKWTLFFGYFVPGVRHFTGFFAGMSYLEFREFALFAYCGAFVWVSTFLSVGYFFGGYWFSVFESIEINIDDIMTVAICLFIVYLIYLVKKEKRQMDNEQHR